MNKIGKIKIENFAGIKNIEINLNRINIFLGPQASGKSIIVKLVYFFQTFIFSLEDLVKKEENFSTKYIEKEFEKKFTYFFPEFFWTENFFIEFYVGELYIKLTKKNKKRLEIHFSKKFYDFFNETNKKWHQLLVDNKKGKQQFIKSDDFLYTLNLRFRFRQYYREILKSYLPHFNIQGEQIFIPAGRSYFSIFKENIFSHFRYNKFRSNEFRQIDPFLIEFGSFYEIAKKITDDKILLKQRKDPTINSFKTILKSKFVVEDEREILRHNDGRDVELWIASSGQQEALPLLLALRFFFLTGMGGTLYIEEPEAHLFPFSQKEIVSLMAMLFNSNRNLQFFITTHSPYILASFNNLMYAGFLKNRFSSEKEKLNNLFKIIPEKNILNPEDVSAYFIDKTIKDLINRKTHLIKTNMLDSVSNDIATEFDQLLDLEY